MQPRLPLPSVDNTPEYKPTRLSELMRNYAEPDEESPAPDPEKFINKQRRRHQRLRSFSTDIMGYDAVVLEEMPPVQQQQIETPHKPQPEAKPGHHRQRSFSTGDTAPQQIFVMHADELPEAKYITFDTMIKNNKSRLSNPWHIQYSDLFFSKKIGEGSFGAVYKGTWEGCPVAIKKLPLQALNIRTEEEFKNEAMVMERCHSPHLVRIYGYHLQSPDYSIVMEYMARGSLYDVLADKTIKTLPVTKMIYNISLGVAHLHERHVVHRDIKSLNIFVDENFNTKLGDYGLARITTHTLNAVLQAVDTQPRGTVVWMAPELFHLATMKPTYASDVYGMGVTFCEIVTREIPQFHNAADCNSKIIAEVQQGGRPKLPQKCHPKLREIITQCWDSDPRNRPSAKAVSQFIAQTFFSPKPVSVKPKAVKAKPVTVRQRWQG
jgi:hypothetical protein